MSLTDFEIKRINDLEKRLEEIEEEFKKFKIEDVRNLEKYLINENNRCNNLHMSVGQYNSKERQKIISDGRLWISKLDHKVLMRIKNTSLIRRQVTSREFNYKKNPIIRLQDDIKKLKSEGWSDSLFSSKLSRVKYSQILSSMTRELMELEDEYSRFHKAEIDLLNEILDVADRFDSEIYKIDSEIKSINRNASERKTKEKLDAKLAKAARSDGKIRSESSSYRRSLTKTVLCPYCSFEIGSNPHLDHIYPVAKGGLNLEENLVFCCQSCNSKKSDKSLRQFCIENNINFLEVTDRLASLGKHI